MNQTGKKGNGRSLLIGGAVLVALLIIGRLVAGLPDPPSPSPTDSARAAEATSTSRPRAAATTGVATATYSPYGTLVVAVNEALGASNRDRNNGRKFTGIDYRADEGSVSVTWAADDNFSSGLILAGIKSDAAAVLRAIDESGVPYEAVFLAATFALQDAEGNPSESEVMVASFDRAAVSRIDWAGFSAADVLDVATGSRVSPVLTGE